MNKDTSNELTEKQRRAIPYLLKAASLQEGCRRARVSRTAVYTWLESESFRDELRRQREQLSTIALESLGASAVKASAVLVGLLESPKDHVRLKAAETIVRLARRQGNTTEQAQSNRSEDDEIHLAELLTPEQLKEIDKVRRLREKFEREKGTLHESVRLDKLFRTRAL